MKEHPQFDEDFDLYALGALDLEERDAIELHLAHCHDCGRRLEAARARVAVLALGAPPQVPSPSSRDRLLERARAERRKAASEGRVGGWLASFGQWAFAAPALFAIALLVAAGWLTVENRRLSSQLNALEAAERQIETARSEQATEAARARRVLEVLTASGTEKVTLVAAGTHPTPEGKAFYNAARGLVFYATNLPQLTSSRAYELWLVPPTGNPMAAGVFNTDQRGNGEVVLPALPSGVVAKAFAVTVEPAGGSPQPTGAKVLVGAV